MPSADPPTRREFLEFALQRFEFEYAELVDAWKQADSKAQITATVCGILLAATFAFVRGAPTPTPLAVKIAVGVSVSVAVATVALAIAVLLLRQAYVPVTGTQAAQIVEHILATAPFDAEQRYEGMLGDAINSWSAVNRHLREALQQKTRQLRRAHVGLLLSASAVVVTTLLALSQL